ncbi:unnamed protein product [Rhizophagus irregularis]|nr:unnamed protein product [Rhizophagus irregularis]
MTQIESHLGLSPIPAPSDPDLDLIQDDAPISHVPLNIQPSAKSSLPPKSILTRPQLPPLVLHHLHLSPPCKKKLTISKIAVVIESKLDMLTGHI